MTRVVRFHTVGGPDVLQIDELAVGLPKPGEIRLRVRMLGLNRAESMFRRGIYPEIPVLPAKLGYEAAGEIEAIGDGVTEFRVGNTVSTIPAFSLNEYGVYGDVAIVPAYAVVKHPPSLSLSEAASIWMQYLTAYGAMIEYGGITSNDTVVITAASSSIGIAGIQIANRLGATPIAVTRTAAKKDALLAAGAAHVVVTDEEDLSAAVLTLTEGKGAQLAIDPIGGPAVEALAGALAENGVLVPYGVLTHEATPYPLLAALAKNLKIHAFTLPFLTRDPVRLEQGKQFVIDGINSGDLKPLIARTFKLDEIVDAHRYMESNQQIGKIVVAT